MRTDDNSDKQFAANLSAMLEQSKANFIAKFGSDYPKNPEQAQSNEFFLYANTLGLYSYFHNPAVSDKQFKKLILNWDPQKEVHKVWRMLLSRLSDEELADMKKEYSVGFR